MRCEGNDWQIRRNVWKESEQLGSISGEGDENYDIVLDEEEVSTGSQKELQKHVKHATRTEKTQRL